MKHAENESCNCAGADLWGCALKEKPMNREALMAFFRDALDYVHKRPFEDLDAAVEANNILSACLHVVDDGSEGHLYWLEHYRETHGNQLPKGDS
jgi:hypothetical protein